jgi:TetR/AcrR family transcriptional regulator, cholesterol catabolism regulator
VTGSSAPTDIPMQDRLLAAAAALFRSKGYEASSIRELASLLGIQSGSLYYHIGKKEDLLYDLCVSVLEQNIQLVRQAVAEQETPLDGVRAMIRTHVVRAMEEPDKHATMLFELRALSDDRRAEVLRLRAAYEDLTRQTISDAQAAGVIRRDIEAKYLTLALLNLLNWSILWFKPGHPLTSEQLSELLTRLFLEGAESQVDVSALSIHQSTLGS